MSRFSHYERCPRCTDHGRDTRGDNLGVYVDGSKHCFSCGYHEFAVVRSLLPLQGPIKALNDSTLLPTDFTREVPTEAWKWLLQYGLPYSYWQPHCGYSETEGRLIFTVGEPIQFSIGRLVKEPKGDFKPRKWYVWGNSHKHCEVIDPFKNARDTPIVIVEDIVSAHKVGQVSTCIPLFGTMIHPCHLYYLQMVQRPIHIWLDKDQQGTVNKKAVRLQILTGQPVSVIITDNDPKSYSLEKIKSLTNL